MACCPPLADFIRGESYSSDHFNLLNDIYIKGCRSRPHGSDHWDLHCHDNNKLSGFFVCAMLLRAPSQFSLLSRMTIIIAIVAAIFLISYYSFTEWYFRDLFFKVGIYDSEDQLIIVALTMVGFGMFFVMLGILWLIPALLIISIYGAMGLLWFGELTTRRIGEYPKGPILAASALFGAIVAIIKALS
jgi:hypothetical protein